MNKNHIKIKLLNRIFDSVVPIFSWVLITLPLWLSPFHPAVVAYFIIAFDLYFFYKSSVTVFNAVISYKKILIHQKINYSKKIKSHKKISQINHFVIIPNYKEPLYKIESTVEAIAKNDYPEKKIYLVLAFEEREKEAFLKANVLKKKYKNFFKDILVSFHRLKPGEVAGKASNQTHAAKFVDDYVSKKGFERKLTLVTICDADSHLPANYFSYLTYRFLHDKERIYHFYWAPVLLYNNFWQLPFFVRMQATLSSILRLAFLNDKQNLIQISTYSTNLWLLKDVNFWDVDIIPEDWHIYLQAFFKYGEKIATIPLFTIINGDAVYSGNLLKTSFNRYDQERRWAWGVSDIGYSLRKFFSTPHLNPLLKLKKIIFLAEHHLLWPTAFFILTVFASIPPLINPVFKRTVLGFLLPQIAGLILTLTSFMLIAYVYLDVKLREKVNQKTKMYFLPLLIIQWYLLPIVSFLFSSLPALDAHTRILLGKKIEYRVTEKV